LSPRQKLIEKIVYKASNAWRGQQQKLHVAKAKEFDAMQKQARQGQQ
jgi:hypothetical protein